MSGTIISTARLALSLSACSLLLTSPAIADSPFYFELDIKQQRIPLTGNSQLETNSFGFRYREYLAENFAIDMNLGRLGLDHHNDLNALGYSPAGYHAGLGLSASTAARQRFQAGVDLSYSHYLSSQDKAGDKIEIRWNQAEARLWLAIQLTPQLKAYGCGLAIRLNGEQKLSATTTTETQLDNRDNTGQCGGLSWQTEDNGIIGIEANGGAMHGGRIYFGRLFR